MEIVIEFVLLNMVTIFAFDTLLNMVTIFAFDTLSNMIIVIDFLLSNTEAGIIQR